MTRVVETTDTEVAEEILRAAYGPLRLSDVGAGGGLRMAHTTVVPSLRLDRTAFGMALEIANSPLETWVVGTVFSGSLTYLSDGEERRWQPGDVFLAAQPEDRFEARLVESDAAGAIIAPDLLTQVASTVPSRRPQQLRLTGYKPVSEQAGKFWKDTYAYVQKVTRDHAEAADEPLVAGQAARMLAIATLAAFPNNALTDPTAQDRHDAHPAALRRAVSFIDEHAHEDISIRDVAAASFVTIRAAQLAFRRHLDTTPTAYLRQVRIASAHRDLVAADPGRDSVAAIGRRWGFNSPSRFAAYYRDAYGFSPSHTLQER